MNRRHRLFLLTQNGFFYGCFFGSIGLIAFLSQAYFWQMDGTRGQRNTLTENTQALLEALDGSLNFVAYVPENRGLQQRIRQLIGKYQRIKPNIQLEFVNPDLNPLRAKQDGVGHVGQLVIQLGSHSEVVDSISEVSIANAVWRMSRDSKRLVVFLEGHDERSPLSEQNQGFARLANILERNGFLIQPHSLIRLPSIPDNTRFLVLASPQAVLLSGEVAVLQDYLQQGGNLLWLQDPGGISAFNLQPLADDLGITWQQGTIVDANEQLRAVLGINHPAVIPVVDYAALPWAQAFTGKQSLFPFATQVTYPQTKEAGWEVEVLLKTLPNSWLEASNLLQGSLTFDPSAGDQSGPLSIGLLLKRPLPQIEEKQGKKQTVLKAKQSAPEQRIAVIGDSDFMSNAFIGHGVNLDLTTELFSWLSDDGNLLGIELSSPLDTHFALNQNAMVLLAAFFLVVMPFMIVMCGVALWWWRRRR